MPIKYEIEILYNPGNPSEKERIAYDCVIKRFNLHPRHACGSSRSKFIDVHAENVEEVRLKLAEGGIVILSDQVQ